MKKMSLYLMLLTRLTGFLLIGVNLFRLFDRLSYLNFMQPALPALLNSIVLLLISYLPRMLRALNFEISDKLYVLFLVSVAFALTGGLIFELYKVIPGWDSLMHFVNGGLLTLFAFSIISMLLGKEKFDNLNPLFIVIFAFSFSMMVGAMWEIFEYTSDGLFGSNMQRFEDLNTGQSFIGRVALADTMKDFILNTIGATIISFITYFDIKKGAPYLKELLITKIKTKIDIN